MSLIGKNIKKIRSVKKLNQNDFAKLFNISRASVGSYEEGRAEPKIDKIIEIANYFSIDLNLLLKKELTVNEISRFKLTDSKMIVGNENNLIKKTGNNNKQIIYIDNKNSIEFINYLTSKSIWNGKTISLPPSIEIRTSIAFEHNDNAMFLDNEGIAMLDIVFAELISLEEIFNNYTYIIVSREGIFLRKINIDDENIILNAVNKNFHPIVLKKENIISLYKINAVIKKTINHFIS